MWCKGVLHFQRMKEHGPEPGLQHAKGTLNNIPCPVVVEALGFHTLHWPLVGSDEGEWMLEAGVPSICKDEVPWRRIQSALVERTLASWTDPGQPTQMSIKWP